MNRGVFLEAEMAARTIPMTLGQRGLRPAFADWLLTEDRGAAWLFGVLDVGKVERLEAFMQPDLLHHLSTALKGKPVFISNSSGLRYAVLLARPPALPKSIVFPGSLRGVLRLGASGAGDEVSIPWEKVGHLLVAGQTGAGKSVMLRLVVRQALDEGAALLLGDLDGATFPMLAGHPALLLPIATTVEDVLALVMRGLRECEHRAALFGQMEGFPDNLTEYNALAVMQGAETLPRVVVVLDEFNAAALASGGAAGTVAKAAAELGWRGRKFGVTVVFAGQDFLKSIVGRLRDQIGAAICFKVRSAEIARAVGCAEAVNIPLHRPGLALSDRWGLMQGYFLDKASLIEAAARPGPVLSEQERGVAMAARENGGRLTLGLLQEHGYTRNEAARLLADWRVRGWVRKDPDQQNAHVLEERFPAFPEFPGVSQVSQFPGEGVGSRE